MWLPNQEKKALNIATRHYPRATVGRRIQAKDRSLIYILEENRELMLTVTEAMGGASTRAARISSSLQKFGIPASVLVDEFEEEGWHFKLEEFNPGIWLTFRLRGADAGVSRELGALMGKLLHDLQLIPADEFGYLRRPEIDHVWDFWRDEHPGQDVPPEYSCVPERLVFVHNDFVPHNVLVPAEGDVRVVGVIDFEWSTVWDPMWDVGYLQNWIFTDTYEHPQDFWEGFASGYEFEIDAQRASMYSSRPFYP